MSEWWSADPIAGPAQAPAALDPAHRDLAIRTIYGEAANEPDQGQAAVAAVIKNRMEAGRYGGDTVPGVVLAKNQFEPWWNPEARQRLMALKQDDPRYQKIGGIVDQMFSGGMEDPTGGATHFVAPQAQAALGRSMPSWAQGEGLPIGRHTFFAPEGRVQTAAAKGGDWWSNDPVAPGGPQDSGGAQFAAPLPDGGNFRTAREGISSPPPGFLDKLSQMWENPPKDRLSMIAMVKKAYEGVTLPGDVASGKVQMTDENGQINPEVIQRSANLAAAIPMSSAPGGIFAASVGKGLPVRPAPPPEAVTPSLQELKTAATGPAGFKSPAITELEVKPQAMSEWAQAQKAALDKEGFDNTDVVAKGTHDILSKVEKAPDGSIVTGQNIVSLRKTFGKAAQEVNAKGEPTANAAAAMQVIRSLDELVPNLAQKDVLAGSAADASQVWKTANANYSAYKTAKGIDREVIKAENRAASTNSGQNVANTVRQRLATIMNDEAQFSRFKPDEQAMIREIVHGTPSANALRFAGNLLGGGGGLQMLASGAVGGLATGGAGVVIGPAVGYTLKFLGNRLTVNQAAKLSEMIRSRAPLANAMNDFGAKALEYRTAQTPRTISAAMIAARNLSNNLKDAGISMSPADIMRSLSGPIKSAADDNQQN